MFSHVIYREALFGQRCDRVYAFGNVDALIEKYMRKTSVTLRSKFIDDVVSGGGEEDDGRVWWERVVESVPEEEMEEYAQGLSGLRENLWTRICKLGGVTTVQMNAQEFPDLMSPVDWKMMDENRTIRNDRDEAGNGGYMDFEAIPFLSQNHRAMERSDLPSPKHQKTEEETTCYAGRPEDFDSDECTDEEMQLFDQELDKIGGGYEIDFKKFRYCFCWKSLDLNDSTMVDEPDTNRDFIATLANLALTKYNTDRRTSLELRKILIANFHLSCGFTFYISFKVDDPSDNQIKPYRAVVRYFPGDVEVVSCNPKD